MEHAIAVPAKKLKKPTRPKLSIDEKKNLGKEVEKHPVIWNLAEKGHNNSVAVSAAWDAISNEMKKSVEECKAGWKSLRDSLRYRKKGKTAKSGSEMDIEADESQTPVFDETNSEWEFADTLSFLTPASKKRRTFSSSTAEDVDENGGKSDEPSTSNYFYANKSQKKKDAVADSCQSIAATFADFVKNRKEQQPELKHQTILANLDRMFQQLPDDVVEELNVRFVNQTYEEIVKYKNKN